jgi:hypothetical protein
MVSFELMQLSVVFYVLILSFMCVLCSENRYVPPAMRGAGNSGGGEQGFSNDRGGGYQRHNDGGRGGQAPFNSRYCTYLLVSWNFYRLLTAFIFLFFVIDGKTRVPVAVTKVAVDLVVVEVDFPAIAPAMAVTAITTVAVVMEAAEVDTRTAAATEADTTTVVATITKVADMAATAVAATEVADMVVVVVDTAAAAGAGAVIAPVVAEVAAEVAAVTAPAPMSWATTATLAPIPG